MTPAPLASPPPDSLDDVFQQMRSLSEQPTGEAHVGADGLLKTAISILARGYRPEVIKLVDEILEEYERVDKWYA